jgi:hypothetical protein
MGGDNQAAVLLEGEYVMILKFRNVTSRQLDKLTKLIDDMLGNNKVLLEMNATKWGVPDKKFGSPRMLSYFTNGEGDAEGVGVGEETSLAQITSTKVDQMVTREKMVTMFEVTVTLLEHFKFHAGDNHVGFHSSKLIHTPQLFIQAIFKALELFPDE